MSPTDDTPRGRPVLKQVREGYVDAGMMVADGQLWMFCGEYEGSKEVCADLARDEHGAGIYKVLPTGSWPGGYLRD